MATQNPGIDEQLGVLKPKIDKGRAEGEKEDINDTLSPNEAKPCLRATHIAAITTCSDFKAESDDQPKTCRICKRKETKRI